MLLGKDWKIESDDLNVVVLKRHTVAAKADKPEHDIWTPEAYLGTLKGALTWFVDNGVRATTLKDLQTVVAKQEELYQLISIKGENNDNGS